MNKELTRIITKLALRSSLSGYGRPEGFIIENQDVSQRKLKDIEGNVEKEKVFQNKDVPRKV